MVDSLSKRVADMKVSEEDKNMDVVSYLTRALGEWQFLDIAQGYLLSIEKGVALNPEVNVNKFIRNPEDPEQDERDLLDWAKGAKALGIRATRVRMGDLTECEPPSTVPGVGTTIMVTCGSDYPCDIRRPTFFKKFTAELTIKDKWRQKVMKGVLTQEDKVEEYWRQRLRHRSSTLVVGILETVDGLKQKGYKNWILPTGDKIPIDSFKLTTFHILTNEGVNFVDCEKYFQTGGSLVHCIDNDLVIPTATKESELTLRRKIYPSGFIPNMGFHFPHHALTATLQDGSRYVVDPCARVFGYKGENGRVVVAAKFEDYIKGFPGGIVVEVPSDYQETYIMGDGLYSQVDQLSSNILKYLDRRYCNYCGIIEGPHPETFHPGVYRVIPEVVDLKDCTHCRKVAYCGKLCKDLDKSHAAPCQQTLMEEID